MDDLASRSGVVTVEEVTSRKALVRFVELPQALHGHDPRWVPTLSAWDRHRLDPHRNPFFVDGDAAYLLARRLGRPAGRVAVHVDHAGAGGFGFWCVPDDAEVATALLDAARSWLDGRGCRSMRGPVSFREVDEPGVLAAGHDAVGMTGRPWNPPWEADLLEAAGAELVDEVGYWRLPTTEVGPEPPLVDDLPGQAGPYVDRRLVLDGIAAVPDLGVLLRGTGLRSAWGLAKRARQAAWDDAFVVRCDGEPSVLVPGLLAAAGRVGYRSVVAPWAPRRDEEPETVHRRYELRW